MLRHSCLCGGRGLILLIAIAAKAFHILAQMSASAADGHQGYLLVSAAPGT
jgi:hypothetical protein